MTHVFFNKEDVFLESESTPLEKINEKLLLKYLDLPVLSLNLHLEDLFLIMEKIGVKHINVIFKGSLNGYSFKELLDELKKPTSGDLSFNSKIEVSWLVFDQYNEKFEADQIDEIVRARGWNEDGYFAFGNYKIFDLKKLLVTINNRYIVEKDKEIVFRGVKSITVRMLIDSILDEITINKKIEKKPLEIKLIRTKINDASKAKIRLIQLQKELDENVVGEEFEICAQIRDEIEKCNKIIRDGR